MKKLLISILFVFPAVWVCAEQLCDHLHKLPLLEQEIKRAVHRQASRKVPWQVQLQNLQSVYAKAHRPEYTSYLPVMFPSSLSYREEQLYLKRLLHIQYGVNENRALKGFTFVTPVQADLVHFSTDNYGALEGFLKNLPTVRVTRAPCARPFTLALRINGAGGGALEVWIDLPTKKIYLMSDNLYTTASGKYGLYLK